MKKMYGLMAVFMVLMFTGCSQTQYGTGYNPITDDRINEIESSEIVNPAYMTEDDSNAGIYIGSNEENPMTDTQSNMDNDVYLDVPADCYSLQSESIPYVIMNGSGKPVSVLLIPKLEKEVDGEWEKIKFTNEIGFCGVADSVDTQRKGDIPLAWFAGTLSAGRYRLSFEMSEGEDSNNVKMLSDNFELKD